jgi:hydroxymethylpyrimidine pyrophosphatase-like HAD family hydrolase
MLQLAGYSVAMSNAMPAAETVARYRTGSNDEGGVGMWLERVFFPSG